ncbi:hypothetical protein IA69_03160 [Massilia sp. JS1662]|nr:hypothetical protein IA69_03160 [Massilia sp. JS1662]
MQGYSGQAPANEHFVQPVTEYTRFCRAPGKSKYVDKTLDHFGLAFSEFFFQDSGLPRQEFSPNIVAANLCL